MTRETGNLLDTRRNRPIIQCDRAKVKIQPFKEQSQAQNKNMIYAETLHLSFKPRDWFHISLVQRLARSQMIFESIGEFCFKALQQCFGQLLRYSTWHGQKDEKVAKVVACIPG